MRILSALLVVAVYTLAVGWFAKGLGYDECAQENEKEAREQAVKDAASIANIKIEKAKDHEKTEQIKTVIKRVPDPSGCPRAPVVRERVDWMRDAYYQAGTRSGINETRNEGNADGQKRGPVRPGPD